MIGLANAGGDMINAIKAANEFGINKNRKLAALLVFINDIHLLGLPVAQGMLLTEAFPGITTSSRPRSRPSRPFCRWRAASAR